MKKCVGCGATVQYDSPNLEGYIDKNFYEKSLLCERCFRIRNYGEYKKVIKDNNEFLKILNRIKETKDLVVLVVDLLNIDSLKQITDYLNNDILLVLTKRDLLPKSTSDTKFLEYPLDIKPVDKIIISSLNNYGFDELYEKINKYKKSKNVYVIGYTNAGKSTMINKLIYNYSDLKSQVTTSILPSTTLDTISIKLNDELVLFDTPGILKTSILDDLSGKEIKKITPKKEIKPVIYQIKTEQYIYVEDYFKVKSSSNNLVFFFANNLNIKRIFKDKKENMQETIISVNPDEDIVIPSFGFIKVMKKEQIKIYSNYCLHIYTRKSLI